MSFYLEALVDCHFLTKPLHTWCGKALRRRLFKRVFYFLTWFPTVWRKSASGLFKKVVHVIHLETVTLNEGTTGKRKL